MVSIRCFLKMSKGSANNSLYSVCAIPICVVLPVSPLNSECVSELDGGGGRG